MRPLLLFTITLGGFSFSLRLRLESSELDASDSNESSETSLLDDEEEEESSFLRRFLPNKIFSRSVATWGLTPPRILLIVDFCALVTTRR